MTLTTDYNRLERSSWRDQEVQFNANVPQFRTAIQASDAETPARLHFIHSRSPHANAVPLLLIPPFPFTNLSLTHLVPLLTDPDDAGSQIPFHLVMPSLPGLGFSDAVSSSKRTIPQIVDMLDILMKRLGYKHYIASMAGPAPNAVCDIDWRLANRLAIRYSQSCLGVHFISPPFQPPSLRNSPVEWIKWTAATTFNTPLLGYTRADIDASRAQSTYRDTSQGVGVGGKRIWEPHTLSYALCDSPAGLLLFFLVISRLLGSQHKFSNEEIIRIVELTWLPGPEGTIRLWAHCATHPENLQRPWTSKPRVAITTFFGASRQDGKPLDLESGLPRTETDAYVCPSWGRNSYNVACTQRVEGSPGLLAWERPQVIVDGVRGLANALIATDDRLQQSREPGIALLEQVVTEGNESAPGEISGSTLQVAGNPSPVPVHSPKPLAPSHTARPQSISAATSSLQGKQENPLFPTVIDTVDATGAHATEHGPPEAQHSRSSSGGSPSTIKPWTGDK